MQLALENDGLLISRPVKESIIGRSTQDTFVIKTERRMDDSSPRASDSRDTSMRETPEESKIGKAGRSILNQTVTPKIWSLIDRLKGDSQPRPTIVTNDLDNIGMTAPRLGSPGSPFVAVKKKAKHERSNDTLTAEGAQFQHLLSGWKTKESSNIGLNMKPRKKLDYRFRPISFDGEKVSGLETKPYTTKNVKSKMPVEEVVCDRDDSSWSTVSSISFDDSEVGMGYIYTDAKNQIFKSFSTEINHQNTTLLFESDDMGNKNQFEEVIEDIGYSNDPREEHHNNALALIDEYNVKQEQDIEDLRTDEDLSVAGSEIPFLEENGSIQHDIEDRIAAGAGTGNGSTIPEEHQESALVLIEEYSVRAGEDLDSQAIEDLRATDDLSVETPMEDKIVDGADLGNANTIPEERQESTLVLIEEYNVRAGEDLDSQAIEDLRATDDLSVETPMEDRIVAGTDLGNANTIPEEHQESTLVLIEEYSVRAGEDLDSQAIEDLRATDDLIVETPVIEDDRIIQHVNHLLTEDRVVKNVDDLGTNLIELRSMDLLSSMEGSGSLLLDDSPFITRSEAEQSFPKEPQPALIEESRNDDKNELKFPPVIEIDIPDVHPPGFGWKLKPIWKYENRMDALKYRKVRGIVRMAREDSYKRKSTRIKHKKESNVNADDE